MQMPPVRTQLPLWVELGPGLAARLASRVLPYDRAMPYKPVDPAKMPPWKRKAPPGKSRPLSASQKEAARVRAEQAGRRYPNLVDNMWAARHVPRGND